MGEISEALKRAKSEKKRRTDVEAPPSDGPTALYGTRVEREPFRDEPDLSEPLERHAPALSETLGRHEPAGWAAGMSEPRSEITRSSQNGWPARAVLLKPHSAVAERFRHFALRIHRALSERDLRTVLIASALHDEGKTLVSCNLALALASMSVGRKIALVDLDLRRPSVASRLGIEPAVGMTQVLRGNAPLEAARVPTDIGALDVYLTTEPDSNSHALLAGPRTAQIVADLANRYDTVVFDSPPVVLVPDAALILNHVESCVAVVRAGETRLSTLRDMLGVLPANKLIGEFLNDSATGRHMYESYHYDAESPAEATAEAEAS